MLLLTWHSDMLAFQWLQEERSRKWKYYFPTSHILGALLSILESDSVLYFMTLIYFIKNPMEPVLVTLLWLWRDPMAKTTEGHGTGAVARGWHPDLQADRIDWSQDLRFPKPNPSDTPPPALPHFLIFPKPFHYLGTKQSNIWGHGDHPHSNQHKAQRNLKFYVVGSDFEGLILLLSPPEFQACIMASFGECWERNPVLWTCILVKTFYQLYCIPFCLCFKILFIESMVVTCQYE